MKEIELYDIITLNDGSEYTILSQIKYLETKYYLIAPIDKDETPDMENTKIVKEVKKDGLLMIDEETEPEKIQSLSLQFLNLLKKDLEY